MNFLPSSARYDADLARAIRDKRRKQDQLDRQGRDGDEPGSQDASAHDGVRRGRSIPSPCRWPCRDPGELTAVRCPLAEESTSFASIDEHEWAGLTSDSSASVSDFEAVPEPADPSSAARRMVRSRRRSHGDAHQVGGRAGTEGGGDEDPTPHHSPGQVTGSLMDRIFGASSTSPAEDATRSEPASFGDRPALAPHHGAGGEESDSSTSFDPQAWKSGQTGTSLSSRSRSALLDATEDVRPDSPSDARGRTRSRSIGSAAWRDDLLSHSGSRPRTSKSTDHQADEPKRTSNLSALLSITSSTLGPHASTSSSTVTTTTTTTTGSMTSPTVSAPASSRPSFHLSRQDTYRSPVATPGEALGLSRPDVHHAFVSSASLSSGYPAATPLHPNPLAHPTAPGDGSDQGEDEEEAPVDMVASLQSLPGTDTEFVSSADEGILVPPPSFPSSRPVDIPNAGSDPHATGTQSAYLPAGGSPMSPASAPSATTTGLSTSPRKSTKRFWHRNLSNPADPSGGHNRPRSSTSPFRSTTSDLGTSPSSSSARRHFSSRRARRARVAGEGRDGSVEDGSRAEASEEFIQALENLRVMASFGKSRPTSGMLSPVATTGSLPGVGGSDGSLIGSGSAASAGTTGIGLASDLGAKRGPRTGAPGAGSPTVLGSNRLALPSARTATMSSEEGRPAGADLPTSGFNSAADESLSDEGLEKAEAGTVGLGRAEGKKSDKADAGAGGGWWSSWMSWSWTIKTWQLVGIVGAVLGVGVAAGWVPRFFSSVRAK